MTQDEIKADIAAFIAAIIADIKTTIEQTERPPWMASENSPAHKQHRDWVYMHLRLLDWEDVQIVFEELVERGEGVDFHETGKATLRFDDADILEAFEHNDMEQLREAITQRGGEKAANYNIDIKLKRKSGQTHPKAPDRELEKAIKDVAFIRELWKRHFDRYGNRKEGDCLRAERLAANYHGVLFDDVLLGLKSKHRS